VYPMDVFRSDKAFIGLVLSTIEVYRNECARIEQKKKILGCLAGCLYVAFFVVLSIGSEDGYAHCYTNVVD